MGVSLFQDQVDFIAIDMEMQAKRSFAEYVRWLIDMQMGIDERIVSTAQQKTGDSTFL